jgi:hypothetical protein
MMSVDKEALGKWLEECKEIRDAIDTVFAEDDGARLAALEKGFRPFFFFDQAHNGHGAPQPSQTVGVFVTDDKNKTYDYKDELKSYGLRWDRDSKGWGGLIDTKVAERFKTEFTAKGLKVLI